MPGEKKRRLGWLEKRINAVREARARGGLPIKSATRDTCPAEEPLQRHAAAHWPDVETPRNTTRSSRSRVWSCCAQSVGAAADIARQ